MISSALGKLAGGEGGVRDNMALLALFGFGLLPFLVPFRTQPIPSFYAEWLALALGLLALPALAGRTSLVLPRIVVLPAGMIVLLLLQGFWLPAALRPGMLLAVLYLLWALLLMLATAALLRDVSLARLGQLADTGAGARVGDQCLQCHPVPGWPAHRF